MESWMSDLPDDVIHRILSIYVLGNPSLTNKNAVGLSLLSKEISRAVQRRPALYFEWSDDPRCLQELKYMLPTLKHNTHLQSFTITHAPGSYNPAFDDHSGFDRCIELAADRCIELAATNSRGLRNLQIRMWHSYVLPQAILKVESLVQLDLERCILREAGSIITWPCLKRLGLIALNFGDGVFDNIIRGCPLIENLEIGQCTFNIKDSHIKVSNLSYLKQLDICLTGYQTLQVDAAPALESLAFKDYSCGCRQIDMGKKEYHKLKSLSLINPKVLSDDFLTNTEHQFPRLEELRILGTNIKRINISSFSLKRINLSFTQTLEEATFDVPNIRVFEFDTNHIPKLSFAGNSGGWISQIRFEVNNAKIDTSWFLELKGFMPASNKAKTSVVITLNKGATRFYIHSDYRISACLPGISIVMTRWRYEPEAHLAMEILQGILSICCPQRISLQDWQESQLPKLLYHRLMGLANQHNVTKIGCWTKLEERSTKYRVLEEYKDKFLEQFKADRKAEFSFSFYFTFEYYWRPQHNLMDSMEPRVLQHKPCNQEQHIITIDDTHCRPATSVKQDTLEELKDSTEPWVLLPCNQEQHIITTDDNHYRPATSAKQDTLEELKDSTEPRVLLPCNQEQHIITTDDNHYRPATSVRQDTLEEVKDSMEPQILLQVNEGFSGVTDSMQPCNDFTKVVCPNKTDERHLNSVNEGRSARSHKFSGCRCFHFPNCKPLRSVKRWLNN